mmetsp:Transcript_12308/g.17675  ORF Transcript_12308/g.17675 Transcript_12308/m.17675 type:complete len:81 (+) Transcript_12308:112-354(+)
MSNTDSSLDGSICTSFGSTSRDLGSMLLTHSSSEGKICAPPLTAWWFTTLDGAYSLYRRAPVIYTHSTSNMYLPNLCTFC